MSALRSVAASMRWCNQVLNRSVGSKAEGGVIRCLAWLCVWAGAVLSVAACYNAEDSWKVCCSLVIIGDETSSPQARRTMMGWQWFTSFGADGSSVDSNNTNLPGTWKKRQIESDIAGFLAGNGNASASDYFRGLGMTCVPVPAPKPDVTRCNVELPIWFGCYSLNVFFPGGPPVPEELRNPMPGFLRMTVDVSAQAFVDTATRVVPVPGGRLCYR